MRSQDIWQEQTLPVLPGYVPRIRKRGIISFCRLFPGEGLCGEESPRKIAKIWPTKPKVEAWFNTQPPITAENVIAMAVIKNI